MPTNVSDLTARVFQEMGWLLADQASDLYTDFFVGWMNDALGHIGDAFTDESITTISWADGDANVELPNDLVAVAGLESDNGDTIGRYRIYAGYLIFDEPTDIAAGTVRLYYQARWPDLVVGGTTTLPRMARSALIAYACYRLARYKLMERMRIDRNNVQTGANNVTPQDIEAFALLYKQDFDNYVVELLEKHDAATLRDSE